MVDVRLRDLFAREALAQIPKILTQQDRNPHSPTYGCFDRNYWHYKIIDFPSGMSQEFVWPVALAYVTPCPDNPWFGRDTLRDWVEAGIRFAARAAHPDGACDDYFPFEKAGGAAAFSLLAAIESCELIGLRDSEILEFVARRADWLAGHHESGRLTNHQALIALCLEKAGRLLDEDRWDSARRSRIDRVLDWQDSEGWFQEYDGADPGYHTLTLAVLAELNRVAPDRAIEVALVKAVQFAAEFVHPDGSFGGEYTSRNTYNFFPHGFELVGRWLPEALAVNDGFLRGLADGLGACYADDHIVGHHAWSYLLAWRHFVADRPPVAPRRQGRVHFESAGLLIDRRDGAELYVALNKGGVFKYFRDTALVWSDTQVSLQIAHAPVPRNAVAHLVGKYETEIQADEIHVAGSLGWAKQTRMTPVNLLILRVAMLGFGRFFPNLIRKILQRLLITGKAAAPFRFRRSFRWSDGQLVVADEIQPESNWRNVISAGIGGFQSSIYVVMSRTYQAGQLQRWVDLTASVPASDAREPLRVERRL